MAGRFKILTDEHWSNAHVRAARDAGWEVVRIVDALGEGVEDPDILAYCAAEGYVWLTRDERAKGQGRQLPGVVIVPQRRRIAPGRLVDLLGSLAHEDGPFAGVIRFLEHGET